MRKDPDTGLAPQPLPALSPESSSVDLSGTVVVPGARPSAPMEQVEVTGTVGDPLPLPGVIRSSRERESSLAPLPMTRSIPVRRTVLAVSVALGCAGMAMGAAVLTGLLAISLLR